MGIFDRWNKPKKEPAAPPEKSNNKPDVAKSAVTGPISSNPTRAGASPARPVGPPATASQGPLTGYFLSDFPPGMGNMPQLPTKGGRADPYCDCCGKQSDHRFTDPILVIATNPKNAEDRWYWERALCSGCYSKRYEERYPGVTHTEIPD